MKSHHKHLHLARRKMSRIMDELYTSLLHYGSEEVDLRIARESDGLRLFVTADFHSEHKDSIRQMGKLLQPAVRNDAMVEMYWELAGEDRYSSDGELSLVGHMADEAALIIDGISGMAGILQNSSRTKLTLIGSLKVSSFCASRIRISYACLIKVVIKKCSVVFSSGIIR